MKKMINARRLISFLLAVVLVVSFVVRVNSNTDADARDVDFPIDEPKEQINYLKQESVDLFNEETSFFENVQQRIDTPDDDLRIVKYLMNDGTVEMRILNDPLKYVSSDGNVHTKSMRICELQNNELFKYSNIDNDIIMRFGSRYSNGVIAEFNGHSIAFSPSNESNAEAYLNDKENTVYYEGVFSNNTRVEYKAQYSGLKEDIVLEKYESITSFSFTVRTDDQIVCNNGTIQLIDDKGVCIGDFGAILITDSAGNTTRGSAEAKKTGESDYLYTISVPDEFLADPNTVYPVVVDPIFTFNYYAYTFAGYKQIYDVTLTQTAYLYQPNDSDLLVCLNPNLGYEVAIIKFPNLVSILKKIGVEKINYVGYSYFSFTNNTSSVTVMPMSVNWQHTASTLTNETYDALFNGYYTSGHMNGSLQYSRNKLDITNIAKGWVNNTFLNRGIMIKGMGYTDIASVEIANANYRPYISVNYLYLGSFSVADPLVGLKKLVPICSNGLCSDYAMKNCNNIVMTPLTDHIYDSDQLLLISATSYGYTIQNPYNDYYLTSDYDDVYFSSSLTSSSYWSFVDNGSGNYTIVGTNQEQLHCSTPGISGSAVTACLLYQGIYNNQPVSWLVMKQIDKVPFKLKNVSSSKYLTLNSALDQDNGNIYQHCLYSEIGESTYNPVFGAQGVRVYRDSSESCYRLYLMSSNNGRFSCLSWDSTNNAFLYNPDLGNNKLTISISGTGYATIRQKTGSNLALAVTDSSNGSGSGNTTNSSGNIIFNTYNSADTKQKWILELDLEQFKKEAYYSQFSIGYPMHTNDTTNKIVNYDFGPYKSSSSDIYFHRGLDLIANAGINLYPTFPGTVKKASFDNIRGYYVVIQSNTIDKYGTTSKVCMIVEHLSSIAVSENDFVTTNTVIGQTGSTGSATGAHLHYGYCTYDDFTDSGCTAADFINPLFFHSGDQLYRRDSSFNVYDMTVLF